MPWRETPVMEERLRLVTRILEDEGSGLTSGERQVDANRQRRRLRE